MKPLALSSRGIAVVLVLVLVQLACGLGMDEVPTSPPPSVAPAPTQAAPTTTDQQASAPEAQAMLQLAVQHYQTVGREQALADFNIKQPPFVNGDLYVICLGEDHTMTANGGFPLLVGASADSITDAKGQPMGQVVWDAADKQPEGTLPYHWVNPLTGTDESKILFYQTLDEDVCGVAADNP